MVKLLKMLDLYAPDQPLRNEDFGHNTGEDVLALISAIAFFLSGYLLFCIIG